MSEPAAAKAIRTAKWATTMTKWRIAFEINGKNLGSARVKPARRWQLVTFPGPRGRESAGIVDLMAIRKDHHTHKGRVKRGDLFEIVLIQIKGGGAKRPSTADLQRLKAVARYYHAKSVVLAEWKKGGQPKFSRLDVNTMRWSPTDPEIVFYQDSQRVVA